MCVLREIRNPVRDCNGAYRFRILHSMGRVSRVVNHLRFVTGMIDADEPFPPTGAKLRTRFGR